MDRIFLFDLGNVLAKSLDDYYLYNKLNCKIPYNEISSTIWYIERINRGGDILWQT